MRTESVQFFTEREEEFVSLLIGIGIKKHVATLLVFLANVPGTSSRSIERGTDLRQSEVSIAMRYLMDRGWVRMRGESSERKGRPVKIYQLALPITAIMDSIEEEKKREARDQLALFKKMRDHIR
ncbi:MAG: ArsR family transcriptional regulator [Methanoregula sp.]|jgi:predicted transcriptional regulator|uniref:ArsR family transcriptional regulator n=1 Tax=Methanoregula sp. TaxID=2052170 RepID=UPI0025F53A6B|nr:ArsR family transcriptional regulator [Methanoregula sp.]MCK9630416.1 ArsR family transcriptional regulator [Methanoregula sp.]